MAAIMMFNQSQLRMRSGRIDIQWFVIQEWKQAGDIIMQYVKTGDNYADAMTKLLGGYYTTSLIILLTALHVL